MRLSLLVLFSFVLCLTVLSLWISVPLLENPGRGKRAPARAAGTRPLSAEVPLKVTAQLGGVERAPSPRANTTAPPRGFGEALLEVVEDGAVVLTMANDAFAPLALHFACAMRRLRRANVLVVALGEVVASELAAARVATVDARTLPASALAAAPLPTGQAVANIGGAEYNSLCLFKPALILAALEAGVEIVVWSDIDITWLQDPLPALVASLRRDEPVALGGRHVSTMHPPSFSSSSSSSSAQRSDNRAREERRVMPRDLIAGRYKRHCNAGLLALRAGPAATQLLLAMLACGARAVRYEPSFRNDQAVLNAVAEGCSPEPAAHCVDLRVAVRLVGLRSRVLLPHGDDFWTKRWPQREGTLPFLVHNNRCRGDLKLARMKAEGLWMLNETARGEGPPRPRCAAPTLLKSRAFAAAHEPTVKRGPRLMAAGPSR
jgi:hypothetical protein